MPSPTERTALHHKERCLYNTRRSQGAHHCTELLHESRLLLGACPGTRERGGAPRAQGRASRAALPTLQRTQGDGVEGLLYALALRLAAALRGRGRCSCQRGLELLQARALTLERRLCCIELPLHAAASSQERLTLLDSSGIGAVWKIGHTPASSTPAAAVPLPAVSCSLWTLRRRSVLGTEASSTPAWTHAQVWTTHGTARPCTAQASVVTQGLAQQGAAQVPVCGANQPC